MKKDIIIRNYSICELLQLLLFVIRTKIICRSIRLIRFPIIIRGKKYINFGRNLTTGFWCRIEAFANTKCKSPQIKFGNNTQINDFVHISALKSVEIGDDCLLASHIYISDNSHGWYDNTGMSSTPFESPVNRDYFISPVKIGDRVWIGEGVIILPGVTVGNGSIIGAHSVVNTNIPEGCIAVGSPAKIIKKYNIQSKCWAKI